MKRPAFQFYPADWRKDMALQSCSVAARGLWIDLLCIAHECDPYGHLTVNGKAMTAAQIGRHTGLTERECIRLLAELEDSGVLSRTDDGVIYSRRMVRDEQARQVRSEVGKANGSKGAEFGQMGAEHGKKGGRPRKEPAPETTGGNPPTDPGQKPPQNPLPSSSSSTSSLRSEGKRASAQSVPPPGVSAQVWSDWLTLRKAKKAPVTATVIASATAEAEKAGMTLDAFLRVWCARGSQGLQADWLKPHEIGGTSTRTPTPTAAELRVLQATPRLAAPHLRHLIPAATQQPTFEGLDDAQPVASTRLLG